MDLMSKYRSIKFFGNIMCALQHYAHTALIEGQIARVYSEYWRIQVTAFLMILYWRAIICSLFQPVNRALGSVNLEGILDPFGDWDQYWAGSRTQYSAIRHYLTHTGAILKINGNGRVFIPRLELFTGRRVQSWDDFEEMYLSDTDGTVADSLEVCREVLDGSLAFIDLYYERLVNAMAFLLERADYQALWGWQVGVNPLELPARPGLHVQTYGSSASPHDR
jgi:hypothetical protein